MEPPRTPKPPNLRPRQLAAHRRRQAALQPEHFFAELRQAADGFGVVAEHFGRGIMNVTPGETVDVAKAAAAVAAAAVAAAAAGGAGGGFTAGGLVSGMVSQRWEGGDRATGAEQWLAVLQL
ncbi:hypothetical protein PLESTF_001646800 [Pleodorina starrii]|nr:hypothetical protein PLESTF_001646800 [Pleodorina starrii]